MNYTTVVHPFGPLYNKDSRILILGSLPSVKSREQNFFYGHPQNRFWPLIAGLLREPVPQTIEEKKELILRNHLALWDTIYSCDIKGSSDSSIRNVVPTDLNRIIKVANIRHIYANGKTAAALYQKYQRPLNGIEIVPLPSTSPANAVWTLERLCEAWGIIREV